MCDHHHNYEPIYNDSPLAAAARTGNVSLYRTAKARHPHVDPSVYVAAALSGNVEMVREVMRSGVRPEASFFAAAARTGNVEVLREARRSGVRPDATMFAAAARFGAPLTLLASAALLLWREEDGRHAAARSGNVEVMREAMKSGVHRDKAACETAAYHSGSQEMINFILHHM